MPVNLLPPNPADLLSVKGVRLGIAQAGIRKAGRKDLLVIALDEGVRVAGAFTQNRFCAAPVVIARQHLSMVDPMSGVRALVVNTGNANAGTGRQGMNDARTVCNSLAQLLGCEATQVLPFSTGVILEPLPVDRVTAGLPACLADLSADHWANAAEAIMTTDTVPKAVSRTVKVNGVQVRVTGIAKGSGMIHPNMATMLGFIATDAKVAQPLLRSIVQHAVKRSFNAITVDGDTSTNDSFIVMATGRASMDELQSAESGEYRELCDGITDVATQLAQAIVRDGEGATKFITVRVEGGRNEDECRRIAYAIAHSPLVKTAFFASDPNLGRILAAIGYSGVADLDVEKLDLYLDDVRVATHGGRDPAYREEEGNRVMQKAEITVRVVLNRGHVDASVWTCDLSHDYVKINAEYRT